MTRRTLFLDLAFVWTLAFVGSYEFDGDDVALVVAAVIMSLGMAAWWFVTGDD